MMATENWMGQETLKYGLDIGERWARKQRPAARRSWPPEILDYLRTNLFLAEGSGEGGDE